MRSSSFHSLLKYVYFATVCTWYVACGRPTLDFAGFFSQEISIPSGLDSYPAVGKDNVPNLWNPLIQSAIEKTRVPPIKGDLNSHAIDLGVSDEKSFRVKIWVNFGVLQLKGSKSRVRVRYSREIGGHASVRCVCF